jgi:ATP-dependent exoDNAse (exonuclease V) beta subunit
VGNTLDYKLFDTLYLTHRYHARTIENLREQAKALLEEADKINERDKMVRHEIESHVQTITRSDLHQQIKKPQRVQVIVLLTPLPSSSRRPDYSHLATYSRNYAC